MVHFTLGFLDDFEGLVDKYSKEVGPDDATTEANGDPPLGLVTIPLRFN